MLGRSCPPPSPPLQVVVKFLRKSSVLQDCWVDDDEMGAVPLEIALLARLSHRNIVTVSHPFLIWTGGDTHTRTPSSMLIKVYWLEL